MSRKGRMNSFDKKRKREACARRRTNDDYIPGVHVPGVRSPGTSSEDVAAIQKEAIDAGMLFVAWPDGTPASSADIDRVRVSGEALTYFVPSFPGERPPEHHPDPEKCEACANFRKMAGHNLPLPQHVSDWAKVRGTIATEVMLFAWRCMGMFRAI